MAARPKLHAPEQCIILQFPTTYVPEDMTPRPRVTNRTPITNLSEGNLINITQVRVMRIGRAILSEETKLTMASWKQQKEQRERKKP